MNDAADFIATCWWASAITLAIGGGLLLWRDMILPPATIIAIAAAALALMVATFGCFRKKDQ